MFLSAVSCLLALHSGDQLGDAERSAWQRVIPSVLSLSTGGQARGMAVLIDSTGLFLAHRTSVDDRGVEGRMSDGRTVQLKLAGQDSISQMVLLQATDWKSNASPVRLATDLQRGVPLLAATPGKPIRAEYVSGGRMMVVKPTGRVLPSSEIRFEASMGTVAGSLLFTLDGRLVGVVGATLERDEVAAPTQIGAQNLRSTGLPIQLPTVQKIGPADMTVAYSVGPEVLQRVYEGFMTPDRQVQYAVMGIQCLDNLDGGALVQTVSPDSPAKTAGLRVGDILLDMGGVTIRNSVDFGRVMFMQKPNARVTVRLRRGDATIIADITLGRLRG